jgi:hypothetical protein
MLSKWWRASIRVRSRLWTQNFNFSSLYSKIKANDGTTSGGSVDQGALNANEKIDFLDISSGVLLYSDQAWFGCLKHLNKPNIAFIADGNVP